MEELTKKRISNFHKYPKNSAIFVNVIAILNFLSKTMSLTFIKKKNHISHMNFLYEYSLS